MPVQILCLNRLGAHSCFTIIILPDTVSILLHLEIKMQNNFKNMCLCYVKSEKIIVPKYLTL